MSQDVTIRFTPPPAASRAPLLETPAVWNTHVTTERVRLIDEFPGWWIRFDSLSSTWVASIGLSVGRLTLDAETPDALRALIRGAQGQTLVVP